MEGSHVSSSSPRLYGESFQSKRNNQNEPKSQSNKIGTKEAVANMELAALTAFAMALCLMGLSHLRALQDQAAIMRSVFIVVGGGTMILVSLTEYSRNDFFKTTMYYSYGSYWITNGASFLLSYWKWGVLPDAVARGSFNLLWAYFTFLMAFTVGINQMKSRLMLYFLNLFGASLLFQAIFEFIRSSSIGCTSIEWLSFVGGVCQLIASVIAFYLSLGGIINAAWINSQMANADSHPSVGALLLPMFEKQQQSRKPTDSSSLSLETV